MNLALVILGSLLMGVAGVYLSWLTSNFTHKSLGFHRAILVLIPALAAVITAFGIPDQVLLLAVAYGIWAVVNWVAGFIFYRTRRAHDGVAYARTVGELHAWLGAGLFVGALAAAACSAVV